MRVSIIAFALLWNMLVFAQRDEAYVDSLTTDFTSNLLNRGVTTYVASKRYCKGEIAIFKLGNGTLCSSYGTYFSVYIFWIENGDHRAKKIDNCGLYETLELKEGTVLDFIDRNKEDIQRHPIKPYAINSKLGGPMKSTETYPCSRELHYESAEMKFDQSFDLFDLTNEAMESNENYEYNNSHKAAELEKLLTTVISQLDVKFQRQ